MTAGKIDVNYAEEEEYVLTAGRSTNVKCAEEPLFVSTTEGK